MVDPVVAVVDFALRVIIEAIGFIATAILTGITFVMLIILLLLAAIMHALAFVIDMALLAVEEIKG